MDPDKDGLDEIQQVIAGTEVSGSKQKKQNVTRAMQQQLDQFTKGPNLRNLVKGRGANKPSGI